MKYLSLLILFFSCSLVFSQVNFNTGNGELDANLSIINNEGKKDFNLFKRDMSLKYNVTERKIEDMQVKFGLVPGEIFMALEIAQNSPSSVDNVLRIHKENKSKGWGYIAKEAGIKPGSPAFHQLKNNAKGQKDKAKGKPAHVKAKKVKKAKGKPGKGRK